MEYENMNLREAIEILEEVMELDDSIYAYNRKYRMALEFVIDCIKRDMADYDKLMTISQQLAFENEELREKIEKIKTEIDDEWANTHHMYFEYASGLARASEVIDKHIDEDKSQESEADFPQTKDIEPTVKGFVDTMDILDRICKEKEENK